MPRWRKAIFGLVILVVVIATAWTIYRLYSFYARRTATIVMLRDRLDAWQSSDDSLKQPVATRIQSAIDELEAAVIPDLDPPRLYAAYVNPAPAVYPDDAPILELYWLEYDFDVDGFDLYSDGRLCATTTGWRAECEADREALLELHENTYDRYMFVDVPFSSAHKCDNNRDVVRLTQAQLRGQLTIQLRTDEACGPHVAVAVADSVFESKSRQSVGDDIQQ
jgi:hypothetical protein